MRAAPEGGGRGPALAPLADRQHGGMPLRLSQDPAADALLDRDPLALLLGMLLDQQVR